MILHCDRNGDTSTEVWGRLPGLSLCFLLEHGPGGSRGGGGSALGICGAGAKAQVTCLQTLLVSWSPISTPLLPTPAAPDPPGPMQKPAMMPTTQATLR